MMGAVEMGATAEKAAPAMGMHAAARALRGEVSGREILAPGPGHSEGDRSLAVRLDETAPDGFVVHSFAGDDPMRCRDHVRQRLGLPDWQPQRGATGRDPDFALRDLGTPSATWTYHRADGAVAGVIARYDTAQGKAIRPWIEHGGRWTPGAMPEPRPLYRLPDLVARSDVPVLAVEGEKAADAAARLFPGYAVTTSAGGSQAAAKSEWAPLAGRDVVIWPDHDAPGAKYAADVERLARVAGARSVRAVAIPQNWPPAFDLADALPDGVTVETLAAMLAAPASAAREVRQSIRRLPDGFRYARDGSVEYLMGADRETGEEVWGWLCSPLEILAQTCGDDEKMWGLLLRVITPDGKWHTQAVPRSLFVTQGEEILAILADLGLRFVPVGGVKTQLKKLLALASPEDRARSVPHVGWHGRLFVLPDEIFGNAGNEHVVFQPVYAINHAYGEGGTLDGWRREIAARAVGNSRLKFSISAAFAGPLLRLLDMEGGGFHWRGASSTGKTTALVAAGSVWGGGGLSGFTRRWRTTDNALEGTAVTHCDTLLPLDEMAEVEAKAAFRGIYMLANGQGKQRAGRAGEAKPAAEWRVSFLSTGEIGIADKIAEDGRRATAGQQVRIADLVADAGAGLGIFENLHGYSRPSDFADAIKEAAARHYGHAARTFLRHLTASIDGTRDIVRDFIATFGQRVCPANADGQVRRVARRFGMVAAAGELAI